MNTNKNSYIITYASIMVVVVASVLSLTALALKPRQDANKLNETRLSILSSLGATDENYEDFITEVDLDAEHKLFQAVDGRVVIPVSGSGLWGPIWGYVALEKDMDTVAGVVMDHTGETPGLGAEIATQKHWSQYVGKKVFKEGEFVGVTLRKGGATPANIDHEVDAISGGTKTSDGVTAMLKHSLQPYLPYLVSHGAASSEPRGGACLGGAAPAAAENIESVRIHE